MEKIVLLGCGGHAKSVVDTILREGRYEIAGFLDLPEKKGFSCRGCRVIGTDEDLEECFRKGIHTAFLTMGYMGYARQKSPREVLYKRIKKIGFDLPVIKDPTAVIAGDVQIGEGTFLGKYTVVNADTAIGKICIINTGAIVEHECIVGNNTHVAVGAVLCGGSRVGKGVLIGANATILQGKTIGDRAVIGAGSTVICDVPDQVTVTGSPAIEKREGI